MKIIEKYSEGKLGDVNLNEDALFISNDFIVIMDGASSFKNEKVVISNEKSTGRIARDSIIETMESLTTEDKDISKLRLINKINEGLYNKLPDNNKEFFNKNKEYGLEISVVIYSKHNQELWLFGDINVFVNGEVKTLPMSKAHYDVIDERVSLVENRLKTEKYLDVYNTDTSFQDIKDSIHKQRNYANQKDGYIVLTGFDVNWQLTKTIFVKDNDIIILATDGYVNIKDSLKETEEQLKKDLENDPLCIKELWGMKPHFKENKSFDDRTYIKFKA